MTTIQSGVLDQSTIDTFPAQHVVRAVSATSVLVPMAPPVETSAGNLTTAPLVLVNIATTDGLHGTAYVFCYTRYAMAATASVVEELGKLAVGLPLHPANLSARIRASAKLLGTDGLVGMAIGGLDMAFWDAHAKGASASLARLLGVAPRPIPAYCSLRSSSAGAAAAEADAALRQGFRAVKLRVGAADERRDLDAVTEIVNLLDNTNASAGNRNAGSTALRLMLDYNQALAGTGIHNAARRIQRLAEIAGDRLVWVEEPFDASDNFGHAQLARHIEIPIQLGEGWQNMPAVAGAVAASACTLAMLDAMRIGGVTGWLQAAAMLTSAGLPVSSHIFPEISAQLLSLTTSSHWLEWLDVAAPISENTLQLTDGAVVASDAPGIGISWNDDAIRRLSA